ncbi:MAG: TIGR00159 family protein, partial [Verrucomicrobiota bacterium]|nr:TIGR00159 family protein [Verrucomicrobiota bacterium]
MDIMVSIWQGVVGYWRPVAEISILSVAIYFTLKFFRGTRGWPMVLAFLGLLVVLLVCIKLELTVLSSLLNYFFGLSAFAALIIFQPE